MNKFSSVSCLLVLIGLVGCGGPQKGAQDYPARYLAFTQEFAKLDREMKTRKEPPLPQDKAAGLKELGNRIRRDAGLYDGLVTKAKALEPTDKYQAHHAALIDYLTDLQGSLSTLADIAESGDMAKLEKEGMDMEGRLTGKLKKLLDEERSAQIQSELPSTGS